MMKTFVGVPASPGIYIGKAMLHHEHLQKVPQYAIAESSIDSEFRRFTKALAKSIHDITELQTNQDLGLGSDEVIMLETHLLMLKDPEFTERVRNRLEATKWNVEYVMTQIMRELIQKLSQAKDEYLRERTADLHDVTKRVLAHLLDTKRATLQNLDEDVVIVCHELLPSEAIMMDKVHVKSIVMDGGGKTSHTAILARAFEIPAVLALSQILQNVQECDLLIVDGYEGRVLVNPDEETVKNYVAIKEGRTQKQRELESLRALPAETLDKCRVKLKANIETPEEVDLAIQHGADGVGLFRSEFLFLKSEGGLPNEEEQFTAYSHVLKSMPDKPVTIRTLDIGGDKMLKNMAITPINEKNPLLGWRAIRFCLSHIDLFKTQLRALLRASVYGQLHIMFPLISGLEEMQKAQRILDEVKAELTKEGKKFSDKLSIGIMIEVPSAAMVSDILAKRTDFFSIGTNDLIQYTLAVDRGNEHTAYLYDPVHPGILRFLSMIIENGHKAGIKVSMCGEMASDPLFTLVLLGLGLDEFSMNAASIPQVKKILRSTTKDFAKSLVLDLMKLESSVEIIETVRKVMEDRFEISHT